MHGKPFLRLAIAVAVFLLLGIPVWKLTHSQTAAASAPARPEERQVALEVSIGYETMPTRVSLKLGGNQDDSQALTFIPGHDPASKMWKVTLNKSTPESDISVSASWPDKNQHALRVMISGADITPIEKTLWLSNDANTDVISLKLSR